MGWECSVYGGEERRIKVLWWGKLRGRDHLEDPGVDDRIILRWIFKKRDVRAYAGLIWLRIGTSGGVL